MRTLFLSFFLLTFGLSYGQDTAVTWLTKIDTSLFKIKRNKRAIPKDFYAIVGIDDLSEIVSANKPYRTGCLGGLPGQRLNWLAKDNRGHWVLSISFGGLGRGTKYIFIDRESDSTNINGFRFIGDNKNELTLGGAVKKISRKEFRRIDVSFFIEDE